MIKSYTERPERGAQKVGEGMDYEIRMKSGKTFVFSFHMGTIDNLLNGLNKKKFLKFGKTLINTDEIEYIEPKG